MAAYPVKSGSANSGASKIRLAHSAVGLVQATDDQGQVMGTAPAWDIPGIGSTIIPVTCSSTAFDQVMLSPGFATSDPMATSVLYELAQYGQAKTDLDAAAGLVCAQLRMDDGYLRHPTAAEEQAYAQLSDDLRSAALNLATGLSNAQSPDATASGAAYFMPLRTEGVANDVSDICKAGQALPAVSDTSQPDLAICYAAPDTLNVTNTSGAWRMLYAAHDSSGTLLAAVPAQAHVFPALEKLAAAILEDAVYGARNQICSTILKHLCKKSDHPSATLELLSQEQNGEAEGISVSGLTSDPLYAISYGNGQGSLASFPASPSSPSIQLGIKESSELTVFVQFALPLLSFILNDSITAAGRPINRNVKGLEAALATAAGVLGPELAQLDSARSSVAYASAVVRLLEKLTGNGDVLLSLLGIFLPDATEHIVKKLSKRLVEDFGEAETPVVGWVFGAYQAINRAPELMDAALALQSIAEAHGKDSYASFMAPDKIPVTQPALVTGIDAQASTITFEPYTELLGNNATAYCVSHGIPKDTWLDDWCSGYYDLYPTPPVTKTLPIAADASISLQEYRPMCGTSCPSDTVAGLEEIPELMRKFHATLTISGGVIIGLAYVYRP